MTASVNTLYKPIPKNTNRIKLPGPSINSLTPNSFAAVSEVHLMAATLRNHSEQMLLIRTEHRWPFFGKVGGEAVLSLLWYLGSCCAFFLAMEKIVFFDTKAGYIFWVSRLLVSGSFLEERVVHQCSATSRWHARNLKSRIRNVKKVFRFPTMFFFLKLKYFFFWNLLSGRGILNHIRFCVEKCRWCCCCCWCCASLIPLCPLCLKHQVDSVVAAVVVRAALLHVVTWHLS